MRNLGMLLMLFAFATPVAAADFQPMITVTGEGRVEATPDMATLSLGVTTEAASAQQALDDNSERLAKVLSELKAAGIADKDIQTSGLSLGPRYDYSSSDGMPKVTGYIASNMVTVRVLELDKLGAVIDSTVKTGANTLNGLGFGLQDPAPQTDESRRRAVADARHRAELFAGAAGVMIGQVISISEPGGMQPPMPIMMAEAGFAKGANVPVASGELTISAAVTVVYELRQ